MKGKLKVKVLPIHTQTPIPRTHKHTKLVKGRIWTAVPDALLGVINQSSGGRTGQQLQRVNVLWDEG